jgi:hypothetical protein
MLLTLCCGSCVLCSHLSFQIDVDLSSQLSDSRPTGGFLLNASLQWVEQEILALVPSLPSGSPAVGLLSLQAKAVSTLFHLAGSRLGKILHLFRYLLLPSERTLGEVQLPVHSFNLILDAARQAAEKARASADFFKAQAVDRLRSTAINSVCLASQQLNVNENVVSVQPSEYGTDC